MTQIEVRGNATEEELAAVLAVVSAAESQRAPSSCSRWRADRIAAVRATERTSHRAD